MRMTQSSTQPAVLVPARGPHIILRALYFVVFGLWFSGLWAAAAWLLCVTIIGLPLGLWMLNRLPQVVTLAPRRSELEFRGGQVREVRPQQAPLLVRALYFVFVGWWLSALWIAAAWALCASVIGMLLGFWMFDRVPAIVSLERS
jgi:uncharacterized membrane protein YccF (DUF307 family)